jgi:hypothetical protein
MLLVKRSGPRCLKVNDAEKCVEIGLKDASALLSRNNKPSRDGVAPIVLAAVKTTRFMPILGGYFLGSRETWVICGRTAKMIRYCDNPRKSSKLVLNWGMLRQKCLGRNLGRGKSTSQRGLPEEGLAVEPGRGISTASFGPKRQYDQFGIHNRLSRRVKPLLWYSYSGQELFRTPKSHWQLNDPRNGDSCFVGELRPWKWRSKGSFKMVAKGVRVPLKPGTGLVGCCFSRRWPRVCDAEKWAEIGSLDVVAGAFKDRERWEIVYLVAQRPLTWSYSVTSESL